MFVYVGSYLFIERFESGITGVCSPHVIYLCELAYSVVGQEPAVAVHLAFGIVYLSANKMMLVNLLAVCMSVGVSSERKPAQCQS